MTPTGGGKVNADQVFDRDGGIRGLGVLRGICGDFGKNDVGRRECRSSQRDTVFPMVPDAQTVPEAQIVPEGL